MIENPQVHAVLIDDDAGVLFYHQMVLSESSLNVDIFKFAQAAEAIEYFEEQRDSDIYFLVFLDINMPTMNGWDFINTLEEKGLTKNVYIVMVTASMNAKDERRAAQHPLVVHYTDKPINQSTCNSLLNLESVKHIFS